MEGTIINYRRGRHTIKMNHMIIILPDVDTKEKAEKMLGKKVTFKTQTGKDIKGEIKSAHGNKGAVRAIFEKGLPGQSLGKKLKVE